MRPEKIFTKIKLFLTGFFPLICIMIPSIAFSAIQTNRGLRWEDRLKEINSSLKKETQMQKHAEILKKFNTQMMEEIDKADLSNPDLLEKRIHVYNSMNLLFLDSFHKNKCRMIESKWNMLMEKEDPNTFENTQVKEWIQVICAK